MTNHYEVLGVSEGASQDEIKSAYRSLVKKYHPDVNQNNPDSEAQFKKVQEAYDILSDNNKRKNYDFMRKNGYDPRGFNPRNSSSYYNNARDPFADFVRQAHEQARQVNMAGQDISFEVKCSFEESINGAKKNVSFQINQVCKTCNGEGMNKGASKISCSKCNGQGQVTETRNFGNMGMVQTMTVCSVCKGQGQSVRAEDICKECNKGLSPKDISIDVEIPSGVVYGQNLKLAGKGLYSSSKSRPGDCYIRIVPESHVVFEMNQNYDIILELYINLSDAILGTDISVPTIDGDSEVVSIPAGTNNGDRFVIPRKGLYRRNGFRSDMVVFVKIETMQKSEEIEKFVKKLKSVENENTLPKTEEFKKKISKYMKKEKKHEKAI